MPLNSSAAVATFQDGPTSPAGCIMNGEEYVAVPLPRPWPRDVNSVVCTSEHEVDASGAIILPIHMPTMAEIDEWFVLSRDKRRPEDDRRQFAQIASNLEAELRRVAWRVAPPDYEAWPEAKKNEWFAEGGAAADELNKGHNTTVAMQIALREAADVHYVREPAPEGILSPEFSEDCLALRFTERHGTGLRFVAAWSKWLIWTGTHWEIENTLLAFHMARKICREAASECNRASVANAIAKAKTVAAVETLARSDRSIAATVDQWDADPSLLNMQKMSIELSTGVERPNNPLEYCTKLTRAAAAEEGTLCPMWLAFLS